MSVSGVMQGLIASMSELKDATNDLDIAADYAAIWAEEASKFAETAETLLEEAGRARGAEFAAASSVLSSCISGAAANLNRTVLDSYNKIILATYDIICEVATAKEVFITAAASAADAVPNAGGGAQ